jgi:dTDP-4-amino-4,6-dideoxygalactose transaminase
MYRQQGFRPGQFPHAERIGRGIATLPLFPAMRDEDVVRVCRESVRVLRRLAAPAGVAAG